MTTSIPTPPAATPVEPVNAGFPDPALIVSYATVLRYIRHRLNAMLHGQLKPWAQQHKFNYARLIEIKKLEEETQAVLLQRLMTHFQFPTELLRIIVHQSRRHFFMFTSAENVARFKAELNLFDNPPFDAPASAATTTSSPN
ncbi:hypothetical protein [Hymenobacter psychrotolerans]|uniref:Uncharacterized protein n=1 Tax=Hymenobacter psychrotolerans DSM 18569 TaxID=1121959 RepID=A0A1M7G1N8_9BACT|nr:hypothetical protein [Hymenobacter psychrotolerans]SHM09988.1 hypothetical protein SAMN02746009_03939 [Hymenobacter psychrotolerans DSM 18569]